MQHKYLIVVTYNNNILSAEKTNVHLFWVCDVAAQAYHMRCTWSGVAVCSSLRPKVADVIDSPSSTLKRLTRLRNTYLGGIFHLAG